MADVAQFFGWFCLSLLALAVACGAVALAAWQTGELIERIRRAAAITALHEAGKSIISSAGWFGHSPEVSIAIRVLGETMRDGYGIDASNWRAETQRRVKADSLLPSENTKL